MELQDKIEQLIGEQKREWPLLDLAIEQLSNIRTKEFSWGESNNVIIQFNLNLTSSDLYTNSNECYLCEDNRPKMQRGIQFADKYIILVNPYPILGNHLTIALHSHVLQRIRKKIGDMLKLAKELPDYIVCYDGPSSGASTSNHFHFQAGLKTDILMQGDNELRTCLTIESESKEEVEESFEDVFYYLNSIQPNEVEPMMNIIAFVDCGKYVLNIYPRKKFQPSRYNEIGKRNLLINPGAIDMAGNIIISREEDFDKIKKEDVEDIYTQVSMSII